MVLDISSMPCIISSMDEDLQSLGAMLRDARKKLGLSLRDVEAKTGVSNAYVSQLEGGRIKQPSPQILHKLCDLYGCSYTLALELARYPLPSASKRTPANARFLARLGKTTPEEEQAIVDYLEFLRSRKR
jgi:transcriptional regulator with XRE-family HTH domain